MASASFRPLVLGRYSLIKPLGSGALGDVFLAEARTGDNARTLHAVKILKPPPAVDGDRMAALERECRTHARLKHSNLVNVVGLERDGDQAFMVMEYLDGSDLGRLLGHLARAKRKLPTQVAVYVVWSVVRALSYLHGLKDARGRPVVQAPRDISPLNVAITQSGVVKLADLGSASRGDPMVLSALGLMKGRMGYLAPEVMQQDPSDQRADVFSAGVVLWECLTGRRLFKGKTDEEVITAVLTREVPPPQSLETSIPEALGAAVLTAVARKPSDRFQTAAEFEQALLLALAGTTPRAMSQALSKLLIQFVPVQTAEQLAALPRPEEPTALADALDLHEASLDEPATPEPANWSMFNESFEKPLSSEEDLPPGAATSVIAVPSVELVSPPATTVLPPAPTARNRVLEDDPMEDLPSTAVAVAEDPETSPGDPSQLSNPPPPPLIDDPLITPTPWDDVKVTSSSGEPEPGIPIPRNLGLLPRAEMPTELLAQPSAEALDGPPPTVALDILAADDDVLTGPPPTVMLDGPQATVELRRHRFTQHEDPPPTVMAPEEPPEPQDPGGDPGFESVPGSIEIVMENGEEEDTGGVIVDDTGTLSVDMVAAALDMTDPSLDIVAPHSDITGPELLDQALPPEDTSLPQDLLEQMDAPVLQPHLDLGVDPGLDPVAVLDPVPTLDPDPVLDPGAMLDLGPVLAPRVVMPVAAPAVRKFPPRASGMPLGGLSLDNLPFAILTPGQPSTTVNARELINLLANPATGRTFQVALGDALTRSASDLGTLLVLDNLALFPGLGDPPRHQGSTHTGRMVTLLKAYEQQHATGAFSLLGAQGQYAAFFLVDGRIHYVCMAGQYPPLMDAVLNRAEANVDDVDRMMRMVMVENEPFYSAAVRTGLAKEDAMAEGLRALCFKRTADMVYWGGCRFEYRPDVRLPYMLPVLDIPASSVTAETP